MQLTARMARQNLSIYRLAKTSGVPYATLNDICNGKAKLEKCSAETVYRLARALDVSMEELLAPYLTKRSSFELFKSSVCHRLKEMGDPDFIMDVLKSQEIRTYYDRGWYPESLYLLAMLDYLSRRNDLPLCEDYNEIRKYKLESPLYPADINLSEKLLGKDSRKTALKKAIPEFLEYNIVECEVL